MQNALEQRQSHQKPSGTPWTTSPRISAASAIQRVWPFAIQKPAPADRAGFSPHEAAAAGANKVTPVGNTGGTFNRSATRG